MFRKVKDILDRFDNEHCELMPFERSAYTGTFFNKDVYDVLTDLYAEEIADGCTINQYYNEVEALLMNVQHTQQLTLHEVDDAQSLAYVYTITWIEHGNLQAYTVDGQTAY